LLDDVGGLAAKAVASDDRDALTMTGMEAIVDRRFGRVLMSSMLLVWGRVGIDTMDDRRF